MAPCQLLFKVTKLQRQKLAVRKHQGAKGEPGGEHKGSWREQETAEGEHKEAPTEQEEAKRKQMVEIVISAGAERRCITE